MYHLESVDNEYQHTSNRVDTYDVLELLFQDHQAALEQVVAKSLRQLRGSVDQVQSGTPVPTKQTSQVPSVVNDVPISKSTTSVGTNT